MKAGLNILVIGNDLSVAESLRLASTPEDFTLQFCSADDDFQAIVRDNEVRAVLIDVEDDKETRELLSRLKAFDPMLEVIIAGIPPSPGEMMDWIHSGATDYLAKPFRENAVRLILKKISEKKSLRKETYLLEKKLEKKYSFQGMISRNPYMLEVFSLIENIAPYFTSVLISGESGTGKEMIARAIHQLSRVKDRPLVICDCASIPENLFESELFGYVRGAFTGADRNKKGLFDEAHRGVIFLDEIGEVPFPVQAKLLRILENRQFRPLGSNENREVEVKVIAATNQDLRNKIKKNLFREDLFHRLNRVEISLPLLRQRPEDIPLLARHFLNRCNKKFSKAVRGISREVQKLFLKYNWPGNVRELENVLESACLICKKEFIDMVDLPRDLKDFLPASIKIPFIDNENLTSLENLEKEYITYLLKTTNNNLRKTAQILDISRTTLYNKLSKYNITVSR